MKTETTITGSKVTLDYLSLTSALENLTPKGRRAPQSAFKGTNFITPEIISRTQIKNKNACLEISYGTGMFSTYLIGLTFTGELKDLSTCYSADTLDDLGAVKNAIDNAINN